MVIISKLGTLSLEEEYKKYRLRKIIEEEVDSSKAGRSNEIYELYRKGKLLTNITKKIESSTLKYMEFWNNFLDDYPDYYKIMAIGKKIEKESQILESLMKKLDYKNTLDSKVWKNYGQFLLRVLHNYSEGEEILHQLKNAVVNYKDQNFWSVNVQYDSELGDYSVPIMIVGGSSDYLGQIKNINNVGALMLGYCKQE